jgi:hypothetical protein
MIDNTALVSWLLDRNEMKILGISMRDEIFIKFGFLRTAEKK